MPRSPFAVAAAGLAITAFLLAFAGERATGPAHASPLKLQPLHAPGGLALPHLSQVPALPTLAEPAPKPKPVVVRRHAAPKPAAQPQPRRTPSHRAPKPVVISGSG